MVAWRQIAHLTKPHSSVEFSMWISLSNDSLLYLRMFGISNWLALVTVSGNWDHRVGDSPIIRQRLQTQTTSFICLYDRYSKIMDIISSGNICITFFSRLLLRSSLGFSITRSRRTQFIFLLNSETGTFIIKKHTSINNDPLTWCCKARIQSFHPSPTCEG